MEYPIKNISIEQIRRAVHDVKGIDNDLLIDHTEYYISGKNTRIYKYPLRLDGLLIAIRKGYL